MAAKREADDQPLLGALLMTGFLVFGPFIDLFAKIAAQTMPVAQIAVARLVVQGVVLLPFVLLLRALHRPSRGEIGLHLMRGALILLSTAFITAAVRFMPIADAIAIFFVEPLLLLLLGAALLKEAVGWRRLLACVVGFVGALLVIQPNFEAFGIVAIYPLGTAVCFAFYLILTRSMAQKMHPVSLQFYTSVAAAALGLPVLFFADGSGIADLDPVMPVGVEYLWLGLCGVAAAVAHLFLSYAFKYAPTTLLGPMHYLEIVSAAILGYIVFGDFFNLTAGIGVAVIMGSGFYLIWRERQLSRKVRQ